MHFGISAAWLLASLASLFLLPIAWQTFFFFLGVPLLLRLSVFSWVRGFTLILLGFSIVFCVLDFYLSFSWNSGWTQPLTLPGGEVQRLRPRLVTSFSKPGVFRYQLSTDEFGRRIVPLATNSGRLGVLFFGCSYTFGAGVDDHETFANLTQERLGNRFRVINAGLQGTGPNTALRLLERNDVYLEGMPEKIVVGVYTFFPDHISRVNAIGSWMFDDFQSEVPFYSIESGAPVYSGAIGDRLYIRWLKQKFSFPFNKWIAFQWGAIDSQLRRNREFYFSSVELNRTEAVIFAMAKRFQEIYGSKLKIFIWSNHPLHSQLIRQGFFSRLSQKLSVVIYPKPEELTYIPRDRHPDQAAHRHLAEWMSREWGLSNDLLRDGRVSP